MSKEKLENRGITLIALIITIIVMLILTGITLSITLGDNGLVNKAKEATTQTQVAMDRELLLSAVVGAIGEDGTVNLSAIVLPAGFTGSNGTYTSKNGNTFTVSENGEILYTGETGSENETENVDLNGRYYFEVNEIGIDTYYFEITNHNTMSTVLLGVNEGEDYYSSTPINIDFDNQTIISTIESENENGEIETLTQTSYYDVITENGEIINIVITMTDEGSIIFKNTNGLDHDLNGIYINDSSDRRLTFDSTNGYMDEQYKDTSTGDWIWDSGAELNRHIYFKYNERYYVDNGDSSTLSVASNLNTVTINGVTYTKQETE